MRIRKDVILCLLAALFAGPAALPAEWIHTGDFVGYMICSAGWGFKQRLAMGARRGCHKELVLLPWMKIWQMQRHGWSSACSQRRRLKF